MTDLPVKVQAVLAAARRSSSIPAEVIETCPQCVGLAAAHPDRYSIVRLRLIHEMHHAPPTSSHRHRHRYESRGRDDVSAWDCACGDTLGAALERAGARAAEWDPRVFTSSENEHLARLLLSDGEGSQ